MIPGNPCNIDATGSISTRRPVAWSSRSAASAAIPWWRGHRSAGPVRRLAGRISQCQRDAVVAVILRDLFSENLAAALPCVRAVNAGGGDEDDLTDAGGSGGFENLEGAAHIEVEELVRVFLAAIFVDAVPGGDVGDAVAAAKYFRQLLLVWDGPLDELRSPVQMQWFANIENDRGITFVEQPG